MKKFIKKILFLFFRTRIRFVFSKINLIFNWIYSIYVSSYLQKTDKSFSFEYPVFLKGGECITLGANFAARAGFRIEAVDSYYDQKYTPEIIIGENVIFNFDCHLGAINKIQIGDNVLIGSRVFITDHNHGKIMKDELLYIPMQRQLFSKGPVIIEDNVWIGEGVAILPNVRIGKNAIIAANSVVTANIPENCVVGGIPAKILKELN